jgi:hypothetical protein
MTMDYHSCFVSILVFLIVQNVKLVSIVFEQGLKQVLQFERVMKMAPAGCSEEEVLAELVNSAVLVQGCWVCASHIRHEYCQTRPQRDYILFLFRVYGISWCH